MVRNIDLRLKAKLKPRKPYNFQNNGRERVSKPLAD